MTETVTEVHNDTAPYFPMERDMRCPFAPPEGTRVLREQNPVSRVEIWDGTEPWLITGLAELKSLLKDPRISVDESKEGFPHWNEGMKANVAMRPKSVFNSDGKQHSHFRRMMTKAFTPKRVNALRPFLQETTDKLITDMLSGPKPADLVESLALPLPSIVISQMLGIGYEHHGFFQENAVKSVDRYATPEQNMEAFAAMFMFMYELVEKKMAEPTDDVIGDFAIRARDGEIDAAEAAQMGLGLLIAGHETSANMISLGVLALLQNPEQLAIIKETEDEDVIANAVEELMRYLGIIHNGQRRIATDDIEISGQTIKAGDGVIVELASSNWDPRAFENPEKLDLRRNVVQHTGFGFGPHQCIGMMLARAELQIVFKSIFRHAPNLAVACPIEDIEFKSDRLAYGVYTLPVTW
ncbi:cytochrome P450 [Gordonia pseudamarae]|uniref:Cytochrome P450 n=1 Tax=Gordonia pseudamarae TaxID=2831662 RepID=A0ABX6IEE1_9ACTN|nr:MULTISPECIES: cytochrome P450 [Gordonia]MBD0021725.1 cytochrome P450 [Gordonia sp. (in: high G+C Gram-positive bacteria)]QHN25301.1 cytochrome P450 [Gordonia pseudamarae]QHN34233.1 cytochrome P450 [Gordonia pseudamarae]